MGYSQRLTKTGLAANPRLVYTRYVHSAPGFYRNSAKFKTKSYSSLQRQDGVIGIYFLT